MCWFNYVFFGIWFIIINSGYLVSKCFRILKYILVSCLRLDIFMYLLILWIVVFIGFSFMICVFVGVIKWLLDVLLVVDSMVGVFLIVVIVFWVVFNRVFVLVKKGWLLNVYLILYFSLWVFKIVVIFLMRIWLVIFVEKWKLK